MSQYFSAFKTLLHSCLQNITLTKTSAEGDPSVGLVSGTWTGNETKGVTITNNTFKNITLVGTYAASAVANDELYGSHYSGSSVPFSGVLEGNTKDSIDNQLKKLVKTVVVTSVEEFSEAIANVTEEVVIDATGVVINFTNSADYKIPGGVTLKGIEFYSTNRAGNVVYVTEGVSKKVVFENCNFDRNIRSYLMTIGSDGTCTEMEFNNCEFKGAFNLSFYAYDQGVATYNNCKFTAYDNFEGYIVCIAGNQYFNECSFDYSNATTGDFGALKRRCVNASGTDGRHCYVELVGCTLISTGTYEATGGKIVRK